MSGDIHALSGAYALDALDDIERAQFERHLNDCPSCRDEVDGLREAANLMHLTELTPAPAELRARVLAAVDTIRPLPPGLGFVPDRRRRRLPALVAAAAALVAIGGLGATAWHPWSESTPAPSQTATAGDAVRQILDAPDAESLTQQLPSGGSVTVVRSKKLDRAIISTADMAELDDNQTYELWLLHDGKKVRAGLLSGDADHVLLEGSPATASGAAVTIEKTGGSDVPHGPLVAQIDFDEA